MNGEFQFTRYLYEKDEVKLALLLCILNKKEESVFWAYELYYSGFNTELTHLFWTIYYDFYYTLNPSFEKYLLNKLKSNLILDPSCDYYLAMIIHNFMIRPFNMDIFMLKQVVNMCDFETNNVILESILRCEDYMILAFLLLSEINEECLMDTFIKGIQYFIEKGLRIDKNKCVAQYITLLGSTYHSTLNQKRVILLARIMNYFSSIKNVKMGKHIYFHIEPEEVIIYETIHADLKIVNCRPILPADKILSLAAVYQIDSYNYLSLFQLKRETNNIIQAYRDQWLYYCSFSPLWKERIEKHHGKIVKERKKIIFEEQEDRDDNEQAFYDEFGYEPDEQKRETQNKTIQDIKREKTWRSFYETHKTNGIIELEDDILNDMDKIIYPL
jgi:hypothetical protein